MLFCYCFFYFSVLYVYVKDLERYKACSPHQQKLLSPTENTHPETPLQ